MRLSKERLKLYELSRDYIKHEDYLANFRLTWMLTIHGFLYAIYGFATQSLSSTITGAITNLCRVSCNVKNIDDLLNTKHLHNALIASIMVMTMISIIGLVISVVAGLSISATRKAVKGICQVFSFDHPLFDHNFGSISYIKGPDAYDLSLIDQRYLVPALTGGGVYDAQTRGAVAAKYIPLILITSWIASFIYIVKLMSEFSFFS